MSTFDLSKNLRHERDPTGGGDRLYRNNSDSENSGGEPANKFTDVSEQAGILGSVIAFGLGVSVSDINNDGWLDIYIANDFFERDYLYINNRDGTFTENLETMIRYVSLSSMGADIADLNNDGLMDIFGTDMLPEDDYRLKTTFTYDAFDRNEKQIEWGYYHQLSQNVLQLNIGFPAQHSPTSLPRKRFLTEQGQTGISDSEAPEEVPAIRYPPSAIRYPVFSEIGMFAGVAATDWSWGALF